jgi:rod shape-determining protein MreC
MRTLLRFILRNHYFILFLILELISFVFIVRYNQYQQSSFINSSRGVSGKAYATAHSVSQYLFLAKKNKEITKNLSNYRNFEVGSYYSNKVNITQVYDSVYVQQFQFIPASIINNSVNKSNNFITLNIGEKQNVKKGCGVISSSGVVGVVQNTTARFASVISILNQNLRISAQLKNTGYFGSLTWDGANYRIATLNDLPNHIELNVGDTIVTSGYSAIFPEGEIIGTVNHYEKIRSGSFLKIDVLLSVDFKNISEVMVVNNLLKEEQLTLEKLNQDD